MMASFLPPDLLHAGDTRNFGFLYCCLISGVIFTVYSVSVKVYSVYFGPLSNYPGPRLWACSDIPRLLSSVTGKDALTYPALHARYGPIVRTGPTNLSYAGGAQAWKDIYGAKAHGRSRTQKEPQFYPRPLNGVHGLISANDDDHSRQRKILSYAFAEKALREHEPALKIWAETLIGRLLQICHANAQVDLVRYYNCTTFDIMGYLTFSEDLQMLHDGELSPWVKTIFARVRALTVFRAVRSLSSASRWLLENIVLRSRLVRQAQLEHWNSTATRMDRRLSKTPDRPDLWDRILTKAGSENGLQLEEYYSNASLFMTAGTETTATTLSFVSYQLLKHPNTLELLQKEIRTAYRDIGDINFENLTKLRYLWAVLQEGLRMNPPVPTALPRRIPAGGLEICGQHAPAGVTVGCNHLATYRLESNFKRASEFHPERWLGDPPFKDDHRDALEPFHVGPRNCLGKSLAWHEMRVILASLMLRFDIELSLECADWGEQKIFTLWQKEPLWCSLTPVGRSASGDSNDAL